MERFTVLTGLVAPLDRANVDTDQIIPKQFLKSIKRTGFGPNLFDAWRYLKEARPARSDEGRPLTPDSVPNKPTGVGANLFDAWRYLDEGRPAKSDAGRPLNPDFVLNQPRYQDEIGVE